MSIDEIKHEILKKKTQKLNPHEELLEHAVPFSAPGKAVSCPEQLTSGVQGDSSSSAAPASQSAATPTCPLAAPAVAAPSQTQSQRAA